jgi:hypothetical protein
MGSGDWDVAHRWEEGMKYHLDLTLNYPDHERDVQEGGLILNELLSYVRNIVEDFDHDVEASSIVIVVAKEGSR